MATKIASELHAISNLDRRTVVKGGLVASAALFLPPDVQAAETAPGVFVVDRRFEAAAAAAAGKARQGALVIDPRQEGLGLAWRGQIPAFLRRKRAVVEGMTLWSDFIICQIYARDHGLILLETGFVSDPYANGLQHWRLA